ncbi:MAG: hypothetical protein K6F35_09410 [Lachnospiraceae bacterium]|nr:hypothetical protein [Lachnospiraceae bacterium]
MMNFCTLFDSYYLDKGIALYRSLEAVTEDFTLYIFCFDERAYEILNDLGLNHAVMIREKDIRTPALLEKKKERSKAEYCWTCTPIIIQYVLDRYPVRDCIYLDSDLYFYNNPAVLYDEITSSEADAAIVEHRFKDTDYGRRLEERNGRFCVEFNYFKNTENGRKILSWWRDKCMDWCFDQPEPERMGDQKYLNQFPKLFTGVHILEHLGGGVAPWNLERYTLVKCEGNDILMQEGKGEVFPLVFYHFQNIRYMPGRRVNIKSQTKSKNLKYAIYIPYLKEIEEIRKELIEDFGMSYSEKGIVRSSNPVIGFLQEHFAAFKLQSLSDVICLDRLDRYQV